MVSKKRVVRDQGLGKGSAHLERNIWIENEKGEGGGDDGKEVERESLKERKR